eukprot:750221-Hanusia_phi.AAC.1
MSVRPGAACLRVGEDLHHDLGVAFFHPWAQYSVMAGAWAHSQCHKNHKHAKKRDPEEHHQHPKNPYYDALNLHTGVLKMLLAIRRTWKLVGLPSNFPLLMSRAPVLNHLTSPHLSSPNLS